MSFVADNSVTSRPRVSWFELFYDLVLVAAILHGSHIFGEEPSWATGAWLAITLVVMLTVWLQTTLTFNVFRDDWTLRRFLALAQMLAVVVAASSVSRNGGLSDRIGFLALAATFGTIALLYGIKARAQGTGRRARSIIALTTGAATVVFLIGAALPESDAPPYLNPSSYALAIGIGLAVVPMFTLRLDTLSVTRELDRDHLAERLGQIVIIALGESFAALILSLDALRTIPNPVYLVVTFVIVYCLWAIYFRSVLPGGIPASVARLRVWLACHYLLLFGIIGTAGSLAALASLPFDDAAADLASYRVALPLLYVTIAFALLTWLAGERQRSFAVVHLVAAALLLVLTLLGAFVFVGHPMTLGLAAAVVVIADAGAIVLLGRRDRLRRP